MTEHHADIFISGGGIAGQVSAAAFAAAGFSVVMADPFVPVTTANEEKSDLRSTAFLRPARQLFDRVGLWPHLEDHAKPLDQLAVIDTTGWPPEVRDRRVFRSDDMGDEPFGWNLMNWVVRREIWTYLQDQPLITPLYGTGFRSIVQRTGEIIVTLTNGDRVRARMGIAADGKFSPLREAAGITVSTTRYGQKSLAFTVTHDLPHGNVSTEIYNEGRTVHHRAAARHRRETRLGHRVDEPRPARGRVDEHGRARIRRRDVPALDRVAGADASSGQSLGLADHHADGGSTGLGPRRRRGRGRPRPAPDRRSRAEHVAQ